MNSKINQEYRVNYETVSLTEYYRWRLSETLKNVSTESLQELMMDLDMDPNVGGEWLYVNPYDKFFYKTVPDNDCLSVPAFTNDGAHGCIDVWNIQFVDKNTVRFHADSLYVLEFGFDKEHPYSNQFVHVKVVESTIDEKIWIDGGTLVLDEELRNLIVVGLVEEFGEEVEEEE